MNSLNYPEVELPLVCACSEECSSAFLVLVMVTSVPMRECVFTVGPV